LHSLDEHKPTDPEKDREQPATFASASSLDHDPEKGELPEKPIQKKTSSNEDASSDAGSEDTEALEEEIQEEGLQRAITNLEDGIVGWDGENDPLNPM
jgi:hypothetical protein